MSTDILLCLKIYPALILGEDLKLAVKFRLVVDPFHRDLSILGSFGFKVFMLGLNIRRNSFVNPQVWIAGPSRPFGGKR